MKITTNKFRNVIAAGLLLFASNVVLATNPTYCLRIENISLVTPSTYEWDVYILHTNPDSTNFEWCAGQYAFLYNQLISDDTTQLKFRIVPNSSELSTGELPPSTLIERSIGRLRMSGNLPPGAGNGTAISSTYPGTKIMRARLSTKFGTPFDSNQPLNLKWFNKGGGAVVIAASIGQLAVAITDTLRHAVGTTCSYSDEGTLSSINEVVKNQLNVLWGQDAVNYYLPEHGDVSMSIYDMSGKIIRNVIGRQKAGIQSLPLNLYELQEGIYFCRVSLQGNNRFYTETQKRILIH